MRLTVDCIKLSCEQRTKQNSMLQKSLEALNSQYCTDTFITIFDKENAGNTQELGSVKCVYWHNDRDYTWDLMHNKAIEQNWNGNMRERLVR